MAVDRTISEAITFALMAHNRFFAESKRVERTQRQPQYTDEELKPFFEEVSKGYCFKQATEKAGLDWEVMHNTLYSDDETIGYALDLSMVAGALIRTGKQKPPTDRHDGLYEKFLEAWELNNGTSI